MMTCDLRDRWIAALRSGKYVQGRHTLRTNISSSARYCCLGVLCEVVGLPYLYGGRYVLPDGKTIGGSVVSGFLGLEGEHCIRLARLNDDGDTFLTIANDIEKTVVCDPEEPKESSNA